MLFSELQEISFFIFETSSLPVFLLLFILVVIYLKFKNGLIFRFSLSALSVAVVVTILTTGAVYSRLTYPELFIFVFPFLFIIGLIYFVILTVYIYKTMIKPINNIIKNLQGKKQILD